VRKEFRKINNKEKSRLEQMEYEVKFLEEATTIREAGEVIFEVRNLLQSLLVTEDINSYQTRSHAMHMLKAHAWKLEMENIIYKFEAHMPRNFRKISNMVHGLDFMDKFLDEDFEDRIATLAPPSS